MRPQGRLQGLQPLLERAAGWREVHEERPQVAPVTTLQLLGQRQGAAQGLRVGEGRAVPGYFPATGSRSTWITLGA